MAAVLNWVMWKESFYIAYFSAQGRSQFLRNREQALNQSKLPQPLPMTVEKYIDPLPKARNNSVTDSAEVVVKAPFYLLGIMFGGMWWFRSVGRWYDWMWAWRTPYQCNCLKQYVQYV